MTSFFCGCCCVRSFVRADERCCRAVVVASFAAFVIVLFALTPTHTDIRCRYARAEVMLRNSQAAEESARRKLEQQLRQEKEEEKKRLQAEIDGA